VSVVGVTGARRELDPNLEAWLQKLRPLSRVPRAVGFGISRPAHLRWLRGRAELAVVASCLVETVEQSALGRSPDGPAAALQAKVRSLKEATLGASWD
jgi:tryptophan synthase alpha subunit